MDKARELEALKREAAMIDASEAESLNGPIADLAAGVFGRPEPEVDWTQYTPSRAAQYQAELADLEAELDHGWPGWREREPFTSVSMEKRAWIKIRLFRRNLIMGGKGRWGCRIVWKGRLTTRDGRTVVREGKPFAVPVRPLGSLGASFRPIYSVSLIASEVGCDPTVVEDALAILPSDERSARSWVRRSRSADAGSDAPPVPQTGSPSEGGA